MGVLAFLLLLQLSEAARGVREQKKQTEKQKPFQNSRFTGKKKKQESIILKQKQRIRMTYVGTKYEAVGP